MAMGCIVSDTLANLEVSSAAMDSYVEDISGVITRTILLWKTSFPFGIGAPTIELPTVLLPHLYLE